MSDILKAIDNATLDYWAHTPESPTHLLLGKTEYDALERALGTIKINQGHTASPIQANARTTYRGLQVVEWSAGGVRVGRIPA